jgi:hypothetical protein
LFVTNDTELAVASETLVMRWPHAPGLTSNESIMIPNEAESLNSLTTDAMNAIDMDDQDNEEASEASAAIPQDISEEEIFHCQYSCGKSFPKKYLRNKHHKVHCPPHVCPYCDKRFAVVRDK